jgi:hypothetical protein
LILRLWLFWGEIYLPVFMIFRWELSVKLKFFFWFAPFRAGKNYSHVYGHLTRPPKGEPGQSGFEKPGENEHKPS